MSSILMAGCYDFFLIKWIANLLGFIMGGLYSIFGMFGIFNIGLCIIVFTIICKMLLFPITLKQQRFSKVSSAMSPELQAIQKKYAGKRDNDSMLKMQEETKALYAKYGTSQTGSCLPLLIQMPILLALYAVIISIPTYVAPVSDIYKDMGSEIVSVLDDFNDINNANTIVNGEKEEFTTIIENNYDSSKSEDEINSGVYDNLINMYATIKPLNDFNSGYDYSIEAIESFKKLSDEDWDKLIDAENEKEKPKDYTIKLLEKYKAMSDSQWDVYTAELDTVKANVTKEEENVSEIYAFLGIDLSKSISDVMKDGIWYAILIPILSFLTQWFSMKISTMNQPIMEGNPMGSSMKMMSFAMPLISAVFCYTLPAGLGLYWVMNAVVQIIQQFFINQHFKKVDVNDIIKKNVEKQRIKNEKKGIVSPQNKIKNAANTSAKNIKADYTQKVVDSTATDVKSSNQKMGSIAQRANMVKNFNDNNKN